MAASGLCISCRVLFPGYLPFHCYGSAAKMQKDVLGGFQCSCECAVARRKERDGSK